MEDRAGQRGSRVWHRSQLAPIYSGFRLHEEKLDWGATGSLPLGLVHIFSKSLKTLGVQKEDRFNDFSNLRHLWVKVRACCLWEERLLPSRCANADTAPVIANLHLRSHWVGKPTHIDWRRFQRELIAPAAGEVVGRPAVSRGASEPTRDPPDTSER